MPDELELASFAVWLAMMLPVAIGLVAGGVVVLFGRWVRGLLDSGGVS